MHEFFNNFKERVSSIHFFRTMLRKENRFFKDMLENIMAYKKQLIIIGIMFLCAFMFLVSTMFTKETVDHAKTAPYAALKFVEQNLKSPSTAKFSRNPYVDKKDDNVFVSLSEKIVIPSVCPPLTAYNSTFVFDSLYTT